MNSKTAAALAIALLCVAPPVQSQTGVNDPADVVVSLELCSQDTILINMVNSVEFAGFQMTLTEVSIGPLRSIAARDGSRCVPHCFDISSHSLSLFLFSYCRWSPSFSRMESHRFR